MPSDEATADLAQALEQYGKTMLAAARTHKRSAAAHRRSLRDLMQSIDALKQVAAGIGIELVIDNEDQGGQGARKPEHA